MEGEEKAGSGAEVDGVQRGRTRDLGSHPAGVPSALERPRVYVNSQGKTIIYLSELRVASCTKYDYFMIV